MREDRDFLIFMILLLALFAFASVGCSSNPPVKARILEIDATCEECAAWQLSSPPKNVCTCE